jgi:hypothetical protein
MDPQILTARRIEADLRAACPLGVECMCADANAEGPRPPECAKAERRRRSDVDWSGGARDRRYHAAAAIIILLGLLYGDLLF